MNPVSQFCYDHGSLLVLHVSVPEIDGHLQNLFVRLTYLHNLKFVLYLLTPLILNVSSQLDLVDRVRLVVLPLVLDDAAEPWVLDQLVLHAARQQHLLALDLADLCGLLLDFTDLIMQVPVLILEISDVALESLDLSFFLSDDASQVLQLLHELDVLITLLVDCGQAGSVGRLHIRKRFLEVGDVAVAGCQGVGELLAEAGQIVFGLNSQLGFMLQRAPECHVFLMADGACVLLDQTAKDVELLLELTVLGTLQVRFLHVEVTVGFEAFDLQQQVLDTNGSRVWVHSFRSDVLSHWCLDRRNVALGREVRVALV